MKKLRNLHLFVSATLLLLVGLYYGLFSGYDVPVLFDFRANTVDAKSVFNSMMFLYFGLSVLWIIGTQKPNIWQTATITNVVFMTSLAVGRLISILLYGWPSTIFIIGVVLELILAIWGILNLKKY